MAEHLTMNEAERDSIPSLLYKDLILSSNITWNVVLHVQVQLRMMFPNEQHSRGFLCFFVIFQSLPVNTEQELHIKVNM